MELLKRHRENDADVTIATHSVGWGQASRRGLTRVDPETGHFLLLIHNIHSGLEVLELPENHSQGLSDICFTGISLP